MPIICYEISQRKRITKNTENKKIVAKFLKIVHKQNYQRSHRRFNIIMKKKLKTEKKKINVTLT